MVVLKYDRKPLSNKTLFAFAEPFGILREHLVLRSKVGVTCWAGAETPEVPPEAAIIFTARSGSVSLRLSWR